MTPKDAVEKYRERLIEAFHRTGRDELISLVVPAEEEEFQALENMLKADADMRESE